MQVFAQYCTIHVSFVGHVFAQYIIFDVLIVTFVKVRLTFTVGAVKKMNLLLTVGAARCGMHRMSVPQSSVSIYIPRY
jgi:hypothetical protein